MPPNAGRPARFESSSCSLDSSTLAKEVNHHSALQAWSRVDAAGKRIVRINVTEHEVIVVSCVNPTLNISSRSRISRVALVLEFAIPRSHTRLVAIQVREVGPNLSSQSSMSDGVQSLSIATCTSVTGHRQLRLCSDSVFGHGQCSVNRCFGSGVHANCPFATVRTLFVLVIEKMTKYVPPSWATKPVEQWSLEVLKDGIVTQTVPLIKDHYLAGRQTDVVDIALDHESCSRQHAAFQFGEKGELYVTDLGSTHGTYVNKKRIEPQKYEHLIPGSLIRFGESSRMFVVVGPASVAEEAEKEAAARAQARQKQAAAQQAKQRREQQDEEPDGGATWGMRPDAVVSDDEDDEEQAMGGELGEGQLMTMLGGGKAVGAGGRRGTAGHWLDRLDATKLTEKERVIFDRLTTKKLKLRNFQAEMSRIKAKEGGQGGLTGGQLAQLARCETACDDLTTQIEEDEDVLRDRLETRQPGMTGDGDGKYKSKKGHADDGYGATDILDDDDDDDDGGRAGGKKKGKAGLPAAVGAGGGGSKPMFVLKTTKPAVSSASSSSSSAAKPATSVGQSSIPSAPSTIAPAETATTLSKKLTDVRKQLLQLQEEEKAVEEARDAVVAAHGGSSSDSGGAGAGGSTGSSGDDALDAYMASTRTALASDSASSAARKEAIGALQAEETRLQTLLDHIKNRLDMLFAPHAATPHALPAAASTAVVSQAPAATGPTAKRAPAAGLASSMMMLKQHQAKPSPIERNPEADTHSSDDSSRPGVAGPGQAGGSNASHETPDAGRAAASAAGTEAAHHVTLPASFLAGVGLASQTSSSAGTGAKRPRDDHADGTASAAVASRPRVVGPSAGPPPLGLSKPGGGSGTGAHARAAMALPAGGQGKQQLQQPLQTQQQRYDSDDLVDLTHVPGYR